MNFNKRIKGIKGLIIDMDGVLWRDSEPIGDLAKIFIEIESLGLKFIFATNNATRTVDEYLIKLAKFDVIVDKWQVINAAEATGIYLSQKYPKGVNAYIIGQPSLKKTLANYQVHSVDESEKVTQVVVASLDYDLSYEKLKHASLLIQTGCVFIGTNPDVTLPTPEGFIPGSGTVIRALEIASSINATMVGKPQPLLYQMALERLGLKPGETLAIGDRLETDIAGAQAAGIHSALVLSGASTCEQALQYSPAPEIVAENLEELIQGLSSIQM